MVSGDSMLGGRCWLVLYTLSLAFQCVLGLVAQSPNSITQPSQPSLSATSSIFPNVGASPEAPLAFKVEYRFNQGGATFDRIAFMNTMIRGIFAMIKWPWNAGTTTVVELPARFGISMKFLPLRSGPRLMTKHMAWTIEEIFDILVEHVCYSTGNFQVNANWDEDTVAFGSLAVTAPTLALTTLASGNMTDTSTIIRPDLESKTLPVNHTSEYLEVNEEIKFSLTYLQGGLVYHDVQVYNATLKALIQMLADTGPIWPMVATYNDMDDFTLSVRPISAKKGQGLTTYQAGVVLGWFPMSTESWGEQSGVIFINGKPRGIFCIDRGDRTNFLTSTRCNPDLNVYKMAKN